MAERLGFKKFRDRFVTVQRELLAGFELRHEVVIVGVKPLGHFQCVQVVTAALVPTRHGEVAVQPACGKHWPIVCRDRVDQHGRIQHMVVQTEIVAWHDIGAGVDCQLPVAPAQSARGVKQGNCAGFAAPVGFQRAFEFALQTHARKARVGDK